MLLPNKEEQIILSKNIYIYPKKKEEEIHNEKNVHNWNVCHIVINKGHSYRNAELFHHPYVYKARLKYH